MKKFPKNHIFISIGFLVLLTTSLGVSAYFYNSNQSLQNKLIDQQEKVKESEEKVDDLSKKIKAVQKPLRDIKESPKPTSEKAELSEQSIKNKVTSPSALPRIEASPKVLDLGVIRQQDGVAKGKIKITNTGGQDLKIYSALSSCGCTTAEIKNKILAPGEGFDLPVEYDPNYFKGFLGQGEIEKKITILSNDPSSSFYSAILKTTVIP